MNNSAIVRRLSTEFLVSDGAMGTELQRQGLAPGSCPEEMNCSHPNIVREIHRQYLEAGADIITTNSFGANRYRLKEYGFESRVQDFCRWAAHLARESSSSKNYVGGSIGPTGEILEPLGDAKTGDLFDSFKEQVEALAERGIDLLLVETMMAIEEAELAVRAAKETTGLVVAATMSFEKGPRGFHTMWGVDVGTAVRRLTEAGADIIGANCGRGFDDIVEITKEMKPLTAKPILAQPNAGIPQWVEGRAVYPETPDLIHAKVKSLFHAGAKIVGGCCGTTPQHIKIIREIVDQL